MKFSIELPPNCPPLSSVPATGIVFRIIEKATPTQTDFLSMRQLHPEKWYSDECKARGLSVFRNDSDVYQMIRRVPARRTKIQFIASINLSEDMGLIAPTPSNKDSHHTWWTYSNCQAWKFCTNIKKITLEEA